MKKRLILFGAAALSLNTVYSLDEDKYEIIAFSDNDKRRYNTLWMGKPIIAPKEINNYEYDYIIIANRYGKEIRKQLIEELCIKDNKIIDFYEKLDKYFELRVAMLRQCADEIKSRNIKGNVAELGVYRGEFAQYINKYFPDKKLYLFDTFEGFEDKDITQDEKERFGITASEFSDTNIELVLDKMKYKENCEIKQGYFPDSAKGVEDKFCFVSLDMDLYQPMLNGLIYFWERLEKGGYLFIHDFTSEKWHGTRKAVLEFCKMKGIGYVPVFDLGCIITK